MPLELRTTRSATPSPSTSPGPMTQSYPARLPAPDVPPNGTNDPSELTNADPGRPPGFHAEAAETSLNVRRLDGASTGARKPVLPLLGKIVIGPEAVLPIRSGSMSPVTSPTGARRMNDFQPLLISTGALKLPVPLPRCRTSESPPFSRVITSLLPPRFQSPTLSTWVESLTVRLVVIGLPRFVSPLLSTVTRFLPVLSTPTTSGCAPPAIWAELIRRRPAPSANGPSQL